MKFENYNTQTGLDRLINETDLQNSIKGNIGLLTHSAAISKNFEWSGIICKNIFGNRLKKLFGPQHGIMITVQDNMIESGHHLHPYLKIPVYSLYSETRIPTDEMLEGLDCMLIDLQDVGTRVYTYFSTLGGMLQKCHDNKIRVVILDRPNPVGGTIIEGTILDNQFKSFVGLYPIPHRHGLTIGEMAKFLKEHLALTNLDLRCIDLKNYKRDTLFFETGLPWVLPSPNLPTIESSFTFISTVLFEGTNISEGRGTTRSLEMVGHPKLEAFDFCQRFNKLLKSYELDQVFARPIYFMPTFNKHKGLSCGGLQLHPTNFRHFRGWATGQLLLQELYRELDEHFSWFKGPYEYEYELLPIDLINGTDKIRKWVESMGSIDELKEMEKQSVHHYLDTVEKHRLYF